MRFALFLVLAGWGGISFSLADDSNSTSVVPNVVGMTEADAKSAITANSLTVGAVTSQYSNYASVGLVISQTPNESTLAPIGTAVSIIVSLGPQPCIISGVLMDSDNVPLAGVTMNGLPGNPITDSNGLYSAIVPYGWSGTVTPTKEGYSFSPGSVSYVEVTSDLPNRNFTATQIVTFTISGTTGVGGVIMSGLPGNPIADSNGLYSAIVPYGWSGTVTPTKEGYSFSPGSVSYVEVTSDLPNRNFTATQIVTFTISGTTGVGGVTMSGLPGNPITDSNGLYSAIVPYGWSGTVTPTKEGYSFSPGSVSYTFIASDLPNRNFTATQIVTFTISGTTGVDGVTMSGLPGNPVTSNGGIYSAVVSYGWVGTVTPMKAGFDFNPPSSSYFFVTTDQTNQDYIGRHLVAISGHVRNLGISPIKNVEVTTNSGGTAMTDANGFYELWVPYDWSGTVTPVQADFTFASANKLYSDVLVNQQNQDYTATNIYDLHPDGAIDFADLSIMMQDWFGNGLGDFDHNGTVDFFDFAHFAQNWLIADENIAFLKWDNRTFDPPPDFNDNFTKGWNVVNGAGSVDKDGYILGQGQLKVVAAKNSSNPMRIQKQINQNFQYHNFRIRYRVEGDTNDVSTGLWVVFWQDYGASHTMKFYNMPTHVTGVWHEIEWCPSQMQQVGLWDGWQRNVVKIDIYVNNASSSSDKQPVFYFDLLEAWPTNAQRAALSLQIDDGYSLQFTDAVAYAASKGIITTVYMQTGGMDGNNPGMATPSMMMAYYQAGACLPACHRELYRNDLSRAEALERLIQGQRDLYNMGVRGFGLQHWAIPSGTDGASECNIPYYSYDDFAEMKKVYRVVRGTLPFWSGSNSFRIINGVPVRQFNEMGSNAYQERAMPLVPRNKWWSWGFEINDYNMNDFIYSYLDTGCQNRDLMSVYCHMYSQTNRFSQAGWRTLVDAIAAKVAAGQLDVVTLEVICK